MEDSSGVFLVPEKADPKNRERQSEEKDDTTGRRTLLWRSRPQPCDRRGPFGMASLSPPHLSEGTDEAPSSERADPTSTQASSTMQTDPAALTSAVPSFRTDESAMPDALDARDLGPPSGNQVERTPAPETLSSSGTFQQPGSLDFTSFTQAMSSIGFDPCLVPYPHSLTPSAFATGPRTWPQPIAPDEARLGQRVMMQLRPSEPDQVYVPGIKKEIDYLFAELGRLQNCAEYDQNAVASCQWTLERYQEFLFKLQNMKADPPMPDLDDKISTNPSNLTDSTSSAAASVRPFSSGYAPREKSPGRSVEVSTKSQNPTDARLEMDRVLALSNIVRESCRSARTALFSVRDLFGDVGQEQAGQTQSVTLNNLLRGAVGLQLHMAEKILDGQPWLKTELSANKALINLLEAGRRQRDAVCSIHRQVCEWTLPKDGQQDLTHVWSKMTKLDTTMWCLEEDWREKVGDQFENLVTIWEDLLQAHPSLSVPASTMVDIRHFERDFCQALREINVRAVQWKADLSTIHQDIDKIGQGKLVNGSSMSWYPDVQVPDLGIQASKNVSKSELADARSMDWLLGAAWPEFRIEEPVARVSRDRQLPLSQETLFEAKSENQAAPPSRHHLPGYLRERGRELHVGGRPQTQIMQQTHDDLARYLRERDEESPAEGLPGRRPFQRRRKSVKESGIEAAILSNFKEILDDANTEAVTRTPQRNEEADVKSESAPEPPKVDSPTKSNLKIVKDSVDHEMDVTVPQQMQGFIIKSEPPSGPPKRKFTSFTLTPLHDTTTESLNTHTQQQNEGAENKEQPSPQPFKVDPMTEAFFRPVNDDDSGTRTPQQSEWAESSAGEHSFTEVTHREGRSPSISSAASETFSLI